MEILIKLKKSANGKADNKAKIQPTVIPEKRRFASFIVRLEQLSQYAVNANHIETATRQKNRRTQNQRLKSWNRYYQTPNKLQSHSDDK